MNSLQCVTQEDYPMQIKSLRIKSYRSWRIDDTTSAEALGRLKQLEWVERLRGEGCSEATSLAVVGWSRATYYRWLRRYREDGLKGLESGTRAPRRRRICHWTKQQAQQVLHLRKRYPLWGKRKLWRVLVRERGWTLSESTVGRIVARLVRLGRVEPVSFYYGQVKPKRRRQFTHHAKRFLAYLKEQAPFPIRSLQVDGGSEFRDEFEQACQEAGIPLYVLPPKKPEYNGCVERANGTSLYEFYPYRRGSLDGRRHQSKTGGVSDPLQYLPSP